jgi:RHS repeat-associated protein
MANTPHIADCHDHTGNPQSYRPKRSRPSHIPQRLTFCVDERVLDYTYDRANRLIDLAPVQGNTSFAYRYNGLGLRTQQQILGTGDPLTTDYMVDLASPLPGVLRETKAGSPTWYLHGMNGVLGAKHDGVRAYFGYDSLGSVRQIYDGIEEGLTGQGVCDLPGGGHVRCLNGAFDYDPYGVVTRREGPLASTFSLGYAGEMTDASGLVYLRSRYMNPATGSFLTQSMSDGALGRVNAHNSYAYVEGNPANFVSPSGRDLVATGHAVCCWHPVTDPHAFGKALVVFGVAAAVTYATMGLGSAIAPAILGAAPSTLAATAYGAAVIGVSGIAGGQAAIATNNVMHGRDIREGLFRPEDVLRDAALAIATAAFFSGITGVNQFTSFLPGRVAVRGRCSFTPDTPVATEQREKAISELEVGEKVLAYNENTGKTGSYPITAVLKHDDPIIVHLTLDGELIETTPEHPFYTQECGWVAAGNLKIGEHIRRADRSYGGVQKVEFEKRNELMYNLTIDEAHTFFVGNGQWLVHNTCGPIPEYALGNLGDEADAYIHNSKTLALYEPSARPLLSCRVGISWKDGKTCDKPDLQRTG